MLRRGKIFPVRAVACPARVTPAKMSAIYLGVTRPTIPRA
jgi:hypothetical protein